MELALNEIWHVREERSFLVRSSRAVLMVLLSGAVIVTALILGTLMRSLERSHVRHAGASLQSLPWPLTFLAYDLLPLALVTLLFAVAYRYLPARPIPWRFTMPGAVIAGVFWVIVLRFFSWYTAHVVNYSLIYGSLGGLVLLILWFNYSTQIMLIGAEISAVIHGHRIEE